jgi:sugar phosphate isomerase/epimerase
MPSLASIHYTHAFWPELLAQQVEQINHPAIGLCIDFGHVWISARWLGYDFLAGIERLAPLTTHFHINDNMGVSDYTGKSVNLGRGDLHLPPGWGTVPFEEVFRTIDFPKNPVFLMEHSHGRWLSRAEEILVEAKRLAALR